MKNKTREAILYVVLALPILALCILETLKTKGTWFYPIFRFAEIVFYNLMAMGGVALALMLFYYSAYYVLQRIASFLNDKSTLEKLPNASFKNVDDVIVIQACIIVYCYSIYKLWDGIF